MDATIPQKTHCNYNIARGVPALGIPVLPSRCEHGSRSRRPHQRAAGQWIKLPRPSAPGLGCRPPSSRHQSGSSLTFHGVPRGRLTFPGRNLCPAVPTAAVRGPEWHVLVLPAPDVSAGETPACREKVQRLHNRQPLQPKAGGLTFPSTAPSTPPVVECTC
jgi:hypothetical protein